MLLWPAARRSHSPQMVAMDPGFTQRHERAHYRKDIVPQLGRRPLPQPVGGDDDSRVMVVL